MEKLESVGVTPLISAPEQFGAMVKSDITTCLKAIKAAHIRID